MVVHHTLQLLTTAYCDEPTHIFTNCFYVLYLVNTQIKHAAMHNNHAYKAILESIAQMLQSCTQPTTLYKVRAHPYIDGNEQAYTLAKRGRKLDHKNTHTPHRTNSKKTGDIQCKKRPTKTPSSTWINTSLNMTKHIT